LEDHFPKSGKKAARKHDRALFGEHGLPEKVIELPPTHPQNE
jgi:hypothetical protein